MLAVTVVSPVLMRGLAALAAGRLVRRRLPVAGARGCATGLPEADEAVAAARGGSLPHRSSARLSSVT